MAIRIKRNSRLQFYALVALDGVEFWEFDPLPTVPINSADQYYQVQGGDRIDLLAQQFYGDPRFWWVIAAANDIELVPVQLNLGDKLRIPSQNFVQQRLFDNRRI